MCGIVAYIGKQKALPILLDGLKALEYRGYDSSGVAIMERGAHKFEIRLVKTPGRISLLEEKLRGEKEFSGVLGIAHTRWATHGAPTEINAHPHYDCGKNIFLAHNGIIENYRELREELEGRGHTFRTATDTETLVHLIEDERRNDSKKSFEDVVLSALRRVRGTYGLAIIDRNDPEKLIAVRNFSPLLLGIGDGEYIVASDASAVLKYTRQVVYLNDGEMAIVTPKSHRIINLERETVLREPEELDWTLEASQKGGYPHFMLKEIFEEPEALENSLRGRLKVDEGLAKLGGLEGVEEALRKIKRIFLIACGTAYHAARVGEYMIEEYAGIPVEVDVASEFRYRKPVFKEGDAIILLSQSGETADTLAVLHEAKRKGILTLGIVNAVGSTIARETDAGVYQHIGPEIGVASTKAFTSQLAILSLLTIFLGRERDMSIVMGKRIAEELRKIPKLVSKILENHEVIRRVAEKYAHFENFLYLGRKYNLAIALEGALKLKEISYIHAEGYGAGEMKHGPLAMINANFPSFVIAPSDSVYEKVFSNIQELKARNGPVIAIATEGNKDIARIADDVIYIPKTLEMLTPILSVIPLQLFAYYVGVLRECDVDKPRNLAKSVTVE